MTFKALLLARLDLVLFCAKVSLAWIVANYSYPANPVAEFLNDKTKAPPLAIGWLLTLTGKSILLSALVAWFAGWHIGVALFTFAAAMALPLARRRISPSYLAELEIGANLFYMAGVATLAQLTALPLSDYVWFGLSNRQVAAVLYICSIVVFVLRGGTYIVRGVLDKGKTLPGHVATPNVLPDGSTPEPTLDVNEYNRGRIIGNIERLMLMAFVALQAYEALAFLLTAKGFLRSKDLEQLDFAEYFLVGTLISSMVAIAAGLGVQMVLKLFW
jgi:hypothetical protein